MAEYSNQTFSSAVTIMQGMKSVYGKAVIDFKTNLGSNLLFLKTLFSFFQTIFIFFVFTIVIVYIFNPEITKTT